MTSEKFKKALDEILEEFLAMTPEEFEEDFKKHNTGEISQMLQDANIVFDGGIEFLSEDEIEPKPKEIT